MVMVVVMVVGPGARPKRFQAVSLSRCGRRRGLAGVYISIRPS